MASESVTSRLSPVNFSPREKEDPIDETTEDPQDCCVDFSVLSGALLSDKQSFKSKKGAEVSLTPLIVDFRRLLQTSKLGKTIDIVPGVPNHDLLHAVVALYSVSLSEMTPDTLYNTVCERWARSILLIRDVKDVLEEFEERRSQGKLKPKETTTTDEKSVNTAEEKDLQKVETKDTSDTNDTSKTSDTNAAEDSEDVYTPDEDKPSVFADVFSDSEVEEEEEESDEEEEDFSRGIKAFLAKVEERRKERESHTGKFQLKHVGIENRLVGCLTYEKTYCVPNEKIIHLTLIAVRKRYRKWGLGKYLLQQVKDQQVVGNYDAVVVHADNSALEFFERYGFSDDVVLNSKYNELAEQFTNCTLMSYLPPFTSQGVVGGKRPELDIMSMEMEIKKWQKRSLEAYQAEISCMNRLRNEIIHLRALVSSQQDLIVALAQENENLGQEKFLQEKEFLEYRLASAKAALQDRKKTAAGEEEDDIPTAELIAQMEKELAKRPIDRRESEGNFDSYLDTSRYVVTPDGGSLKEPYDHGKDIVEFHKVTEDFKDGMSKDKTITAKYDVKMITKAALNLSVQEHYVMRANQLKDPSVKMRLYYCGSLEHPDRIPEILKNGFSEGDFNTGDFGRGLYFSQYPSKAAQFSAIGKLILAEVALGKTDSVLKKDRSRSFPPRGFDSILTPGRLTGADGDNRSLYQEYVVFDINQVMPLHLIEYSAT